MKDKMRAERAMVVFAVFVLMTFLALDVIYGAKMPEITCGKLAKELGYEHHKYNHLTGCVVLQDSKWVQIQLPQERKKDGKHPAR